MEGMPEKNTSCLASSSKTVVVLLSLAVAADAGGDMFQVVVTLTGRGAGIHFLSPQPPLNNDELRYICYNLHILHPHRSPRRVHGRMLVSKTPEMWIWFRWLEKSAEGGGSTGNPAAFCRLGSAVGAAVTRR